MPQINFIIHFLLEILHFKEFCNLIGQQYFGQPEFYQICNWWWITKNNISFQFRLFPGEANEKFFLKNPKNPILGAISGLFCPNLDKMIFLGKRGLSDFKYSNYLPLCKNSVKTNASFLRKMQSWWTGGLTDSLTKHWFYRTLLSSRVENACTKSFHDWIVIHHLCLYILSIFKFINDLVW